MTRIIIALVILVSVAVGQETGRFVRRAVNATGAKAGSTTLNTPDTVRTVLISPTLNNGGFDTDAGWFANAGMTISGGRCNVTASTFYVAIEVLIKANTRYVLNYTWTSDGGIQASVGTPGLVYGAGEITEIFLTAGPYTMLVLYPQATIGTIDNVTLTELTSVVKTEHWSISAQSAKIKHAIYTMGNSITALGLYQIKLQDLLGQLFQVVNVGIGGNTTRQMRSRFAADVINHTNVEWIAILGGINDIRYDSSAASITSNLQAMYTSAHNAGIRVVAIKMTPFKNNVLWSADRQAVFDTVNAWISGGAEDVDYVVDGFAALNDTADSGAMAAEWDSGDHVHPSSAGLYQLASVIYNTVPFYPNGSGYATEGTVDLNGIEMLKDTSYSVFLHGYRCYYGAIDTSTATFSGRPVKFRFVSDGNAHAGMYTDSVRNTSTNNFTYTVSLFSPSTATGKNVNIRLYDEISNSNLGEAGAILESGVWTDMALNISASGTQRGFTAYINYTDPSSTPNHDTLLIGNASLTQSYDAVGSGVFSSSATGIMDILNSSKSASSAFRFYLNNTTPTVEVSDGTTTVTATNAATVNDGKNHSWTATLNRTGNLTLYIDGVAGTGVSAVGLGKILVDTVRIGRGVTTNYFTGSIGQTVFAKGNATDWTTYPARAYSAMKAEDELPIPTGCVFNVPFIDNGNDVSGSRNNLAPQGGARITE